MLKLSLMTNLIQNINDCWSKEEYPEPRSTGEPRKPMDKAQRIQSHVQGVRAPEPRVRAFAYHRMREYEYDAHYDEQQHAGHTLKEIKIVPYHFR